jgi:hypothetical protein
MPACSACRLRCWQLYRADVEAKKADVEAKEADVEAKNNNGGINKGYVTRKKINEKKTHK